MRLAIILSVVFGAVALAQSAGSIAGAAGLVARGCPAACAINCPDVSSLRFKLADYAANAMD